MTIKSPKEMKQSQAHRLGILQWPTERLSQGLGLSFKDGYNFGIGLGVAIVFVLPIIVTVISCAAWLIFILFGSWLGSMF